MPKVKYLGPTHELQVDDIIIQRGAEVELTDEQLERARGASSDTQLEVDGKAPNTPGTSTTSDEATPTPPVQPSTGTTRVNTAALNPETTAGGKP
jgi:hypothetical protein